MRIIKFLIQLPIIFPVMLLFKIYLVYRLVDETEDTFAIMEIETEEELDEILQPHLESFYETYKIPMYILTAFIWTKILSQFY
jgi:hypothetical protein